MSQADIDHGCGPACPGCWWCLPARPDADDTAEGGPPKAVFLCLCGHDEGAHALVDYDYQENEHWTCRVCGCRDFEVAS